MSRTFTGWLSWWSWPLAHDLVALAMPGRGGWPCRAVAHELQRWPLAVHGGVLAVLVARAMPGRSGWPVALIRWRWPSWWRWQCRAAGRGGWPVELVQRWPVAQAVSQTFTGWLCRAVAHDLVELLQRWPYLERSPAGRPGGADPLALAVPGRWLCLVELAAGAHDLVQRWPVALIR